MQRKTPKTRLDPEQLAGFLSRYDEAIALGYHENPFFEVWPRPKDERGRSKRTKQRNLLERLHRYRTETLNFMFDFRIPFGNNQAERDIRMTKSSAEGLRRLPLIPGRQDLLPDQGLHLYGQEELCSCIGGDP